jgi:hypothetical protein
MGYGRLYLSTVLPLRTLSEANQGGKLKDKLKRKREQKIVTHGLLWQWKPMLGVPATVKFTRIGPRKLDDDNLRSSMKVIRDTVAKLVGVDDGDARYTWEYAQEQGREYGVRVEFTREESNVEINL